MDALRNADVELISLVAEKEGAIIGHILFSPVSIDGQGYTMGLAPMAVLPVWQRQDIGSQLVNAGFTACEQACYRAVVVLGYADYYPRFGFEPSVKFGIQSEYDAPPEVFMIMELQAGALTGISGTVKYHPVFNEVV